MGTLLDSKEILKVWDECGKGCTWEEYAEALNKAQLKKMVENSHSKPIYAEVDDLGQCAIIIIHIPIDDWQALY